MMKKVVITTALVATLCVGLVACSAAEAPEQQNGTSTNEAQNEAPTVETAGPAPAANMFGNEIPEFDQQCLSCHGSYEEVAAKTADYGDSNPHDSVHGGYDTCEKCHAADKVVNEDHACKSCHAWPRAEDGHL